MRRENAPSETRGPSIRKILAVFFLGENRLSMCARLVIICLFAVVIALAGDLLGVASVLSAFMFG